MPWVKQLPSGRYRVQWRDRLGNKVGPTPARSFPTSTAARNFGLDREAEVRRGDDVDHKAGRVLLKVWIKEWAQGRVSEPRTAVKVDGHIRNYVLKPVGQAPPLGDLPLDEISGHVLQSWVRRVHDTGLAPATVRAVYTTVATALGAAVRARRMAIDPRGDIQLPTIPPADDFFWQRDELDAIRAQMDDLQDLALFELLVGTGMRWGEAAGLHLPRWQPLRRRVTVLEVLSEGSSFTLKPYPKGKKPRDLPVVAPELLDAMAAHLAAGPVVDCGLHGEARGRRQTCGGLIFHDDGRPLSRRAWPTQVLQPAIKAAGVRPGTVHDLRHTYASLRVIDGVPLRVVQALLGHASIRTTERYAHLAEDSLDDPRLTASLLGRTAGAREAAREAPPLNQPDLVDRSDQEDRTSAASAS